MNILKVIYIALLHVTILILLIEPYYGNRVLAAFGLQSNCRLTTHYDEMLAFHIRQDQNLSRGYVVFIGDSHVQGLAVNEITPLAVNYGIGSDTTVGVFNRIKHYQSLRRAKLIVLMIGFNDLKIRETEQIIKNIEALVKLTPENVPLLITSLLPVDEKKFIGSEFNERIKQINASLSQFEREYRYVSYVDAAKLLVGSDGGLDPRFHIGDGVHLNGLGYSILIDLLRAKIESIQSSKLL